MYDKLKKAVVNLVSMAEEHIIKEDFDELDTAGVAILECIDELKAYRDAKESGLLVKLPVKVGDTVYTNCRMSGWYFKLKDAPYRAKVVFIGLNDSEEMGGGLFNIEYENRGHMWQFRFSDIGKTVFLTKEEAETAIKND